MRTKTSAGELARISEATGEIAALEAQAARAKEDFQEQERDADKLLADAAHEGLTPEIPRLSSHRARRRARPARRTGSRPGTARQGRGRHRRAGPAAGNSHEHGSASLQALASTLARKRDTANTALEEYRQALGRLQDNVITALREAANAGQALRQERACPRASR